jgi:hypothetical protein
MLFQRGPFMAALAVHIRLQPKAEANGLKELG